MEITSYPSLSRISLIAGPLKSSRSPLYPESLAVIIAARFILSSYL